MHTCTCMHCQRSRACVASDASTVLSQEQEPWSFLDGMSAEPSFTAPTMLVPAAKSAVALPTSTSEFMSYNASAAMPSSSASSSSASVDSEPFGRAKDVDLDLSVHRCGY